RAAVLSCDLAAAALRSAPPRLPRIRSRIRRRRSGQMRPSWITRTPSPPAPRIRRPSWIRIPRMPTPPRIHCHAQLGPEPRRARLSPLPRAPFVSRLEEPRRQPPPTHIGVKLFS
uniref:Uncharacterized protein n=1 Tax=Aegilops tauschii subsp. strangulata TaxID=200361 RepID=A0A453KH88_AEGTS